MELHQLAYFVAVAEEGGFTRAAERVHVSQSGVSAQVRRLERELGAELIDRSSRRARLTAAGAAALEPARAALAAAAAVRQAVDDVNGVLRGRLAVGMVVGCTVAPLFDALAAFRRRHPGVEVTVGEAGSDVLAEQVARRALDVALIGSADGVPAGLEGMVLLSEPLVAGVPDGHRLAPRARAELAELAGEPLVCLPPGTGIRTVFDRACAAVGVDATVALEASAPDAVAGLAARGLGVAILSASMLAGQDALHPLRLDGAGAHADLALVWGRGDGPARDAFLACAREAFAVPAAA